MFSEVKQLNSDVRDRLRNFNLALDRGEDAIIDENDNNKSQEIIDTVEELEQEINSLYNALETINGNIDNFEKAIAQSKIIRQKEIAAHKLEEGDLDIRDILEDNE